MTVKADDGTSGIVGTDNGYLGYADSAGIIAGSGYGDNGGTITVNGNVDVLVQGSGLVAKGANSSLTVNGGGAVETVKGKSVGYAVAAEDGVVSVNINDTHDGTASNALSIKGNVAALDESGVVNLGFSGIDSILDGVVYNDAGTVNIYMDKGAVWTNNAWGKIEEDFQGSHVSHFVAIPLLSISMMEQHRIPLMEAVSILSMQRRVQKLPCLQIIRESVQASKTMTVMRIKCLWLMLWKSWPINCTILITQMGT